MNERKSGLAIASVALAIISILTCGGFLVLPLLGLLLGIVAIVQINGSRGELAGLEMAVTGVVLSALMVVAVPVTAAIMFPVFAKAREQARHQTCMVNEKQIALGLLQYAMDYDERYPPPGRSWAQATAPYLRNFEVLRCPSDEKLPSYELPRRVRGEPIRWLGNPSNRILIYETDGSGVALRHNDGANFAYLDGHCKWLDKNHLPPGMKAAKEPARKL